jgi:hypothetical protein
MLLLYPACTYPSIRHCSLTSLAYLQTVPFLSQAHCICVLMYRYFQCTSCSGLFCRGPLGTTPLSPCLSSTRRHILYRETPRRKLFFEPFSTLFLCPPGMAELPFDYLSKHFASPLAGFLRADDSYNLAALKHTMRFCKQYITVVENVRRVLALHLDHLVDPGRRRVSRSENTFQSL